jgi:biotin carboxylase
MSITEKQKIMVLGAGRDQVPIIKKAQQMGFDTIVVSVGGNYPGFLIADKSYEVNVVDKERVLEVARLEKICGIVTDALDASVPTVAYVAEKMGLPGIGHDCALKFTNKYEMRQVCTKIGIPVPKHFRAATLGEAMDCSKELSFPLMIKPVDSGGSRGVSKVNHLSEFESKFDNALRCSRSKKVIIEEFFQGNEFVVAGFVIDHEYTNLGIGERYYFTIPDLFVPSRTLFPCLLSQDLKERVIEMDARLVRHCGLEFGITHSEYLIDRENGDVRLVEIAARGGGVFIASGLTPLSCGIDPTELLIELATGKTGVRIDSNRRVNRASGYICFYLPEGTIREIVGLDEVSRLSGVYRAYLEKIQVGKQTKPMTNKGDRIGPILIRGEDRRELQDVIRRVQDTLFIRVETANGIGGIIW